MLCYRRQARRAPAERVHSSIGVGIGIGIGIGPAWSASFRTPDSDTDPDTEGDPRHDTNHWMLHQSREVRKDHSFLINLYLLRVLCR